MYDEFITPFVKLWYIYIYLIDYQWDCPQFLKIFPKANKRHFTRYGRSVQSNRRHTGVWINDWRTRQKNGDSATKISRQRRHVKQKLVQSVKFLRHIISAEKEIQPDPDKIKAVKKLEKLQSAIELWRFLDMVHDYLKLNHLANYLAISDSVKKLLKKDHEFT